MLKAIDGVSLIETQTYTVRKITMSWISYHKVQDMDVTLLWYKIKSNKILFVLKIPAHALLKKKNDYEDGEKGLSKLH